VDCNALVADAGVKKEYYFLNYKNYCNELLTVIIPMQNSTNSFCDIVFIFWAGTTLDELRECSTIIYCNDVPMLNSMLKWSRE
jgi:hypothetical protein